MSALGQETDILSASTDVRFTSENGQLERVVDVRFVPIADIVASIDTPHGRP
jgi:hypothetical protein